MIFDSPSATLDGPQELEANQWAGKWLISDEHESRLVLLKSKANVVAFARSIQIHPGTVMGRLQHHQFIKPWWMTDLKESFRFVVPAS
jgi:HTH-type transcriptional regulator/antitoxin HigA